MVLKPQLITFLFLISILFSSLHSYGKGKLTSDETLLKSDISETCSFKWKNLTDKINKTIQRTAAPASAVALSILSCMTMGQMLFEGQFKENVPDTPIEALEQKISIDASKEFMETVRQADKIAAFDIRVYQDTSTGKPRNIIFLGELHERGSRERAEEVKTVGKKLLNFFDNVGVERFEFEKFPMSHWTIKQITGESQINTSCDESSSAICSAREIGRAASGKIQVANLENSIEPSFLEKAGFLYTGLLYAEKNLSPYIVLLPSLAAALSVLSAGKSKKQKKKLLWTLIAMSLQLHAFHLDSVGKALVNQNTNNGLLWVFNPENAVLLKSRDAQMGKSLNTLLKTDPKIENIAVVAGCQHDIKKELGGNFKLIYSSVTDPGSIY